MNQFTITYKDITVQVTQFSGETPIVFMFDAESNRTRVYIEDVDPEWDYPGLVKQITSNVLKLK